MAAMIDSMVGRGRETAGLGNGYSTDDAASDVRHLYHLLDIAFDELLNVNFGCDPAGRVHLDRLSALLWVARDNAQRIGDGLGDAA